MTLREAIAVILAKSAVAMRTIEYRNRLYRAIAASTMRQSVFDRTFRDARIEDTRLRVRAYCERGGTVPNECAKPNNARVRP